MTALRLVASVSLLLPLALLLLWLTWTLLRRRETRARRWLGLGYLLLAASLAGPVFGHLLATGPAEPAALVKIWSGAGLGEGEVAVSLSVSGAGLFEEPREWTGLLEPHMVTLVLAALLLASAMGLWRLARTWWRVRRDCQDLPVLRRRGRLRICVSDEGTVPFSVWTGSEAYVVLPVALLADPPRLHLTVRHELEHLRWKDTTWVYILELVRALLPWHPAAHAWCAFLGRLQEYACDQSLLARGAPLEAYADCLIRAAGPAPPKLSPSAIAVGLGGGRRHLRRRIEMLVIHTARHSRWIVPAVAVASVTLLGLAAVQAETAVADRRVTRAEAESLSAAVAERSGFRVGVDETVLEQLNAMVGAEDARAWWRASLERGEGLRPEIDAVLQRHGVPAELAAVALVESGFRNLPPAEDDPRRLGAGVWQFIPGTARHFGLRVDDTTDERMDVSLSTDAAARYLAELHGEFESWPLAIAAYTHGAGTLRQVIADSGTRAASTLVEKGALQPYSSQVLAAVLLMEKPDLVR
jgi:soluble lytic murein transglycosylase-like protein